MAKITMPTAKSRSARVVAALCVGCLLATLATSCSKNRRDQVIRTPKAKKSIYVDNYPMEYFTQRIVGEQASVVFPAPPDGDPAYWKPDEDTLYEYRSADLVLLNGAGYARWVDDLSLPLATAVDTSKILRNQYLTVDETTTHSHGPEGAHEHKGAKLDPHMWLDPLLARVQAQTIEDTVARLLPEYSAEFEENFRRLEDDLQTLDSSIRTAVDRYLNEPLLASHPVYNYLARRCGWRLKSLHWEPDQVPNEHEWQEFAKLHKEFPAKWMLWEAPPRKETIERLQGFGVRCVVFYPCANRPKQGDYLQVMRENVDRLKPIFQSFGPPSRSDTHQTLPWSTGTRRGR